MNNRMLLYKRNKNIFLEKWDNSIIIRGIESIIKKAGAFLPISPRIIFSERVIEYPIVFQYLGTDSPGCHILDFGCVEDLLPIHLASMGYRVTGMDFREYPFTHKNFDFIQCDILAWNPPTGLYDKVISVSTIEHVGLASYGDPKSSDGDRVAVNKLYQSLKKGGQLIMTVPAGKPCIERGMRVYDGRSIRALVPNVETLKFFSKKSREADWVETSEEAIATLVYDNYQTTSPAQGVAFIVSRKV